MKKIFLLLFFCLTPALAYSQVYKFVDENGIIHFTNTPTDNRYKKYLPEEKKAQNVSAPDKVRSIPQNIQPVETHSEPITKSGTNYIGASGKLYIPVGTTGVIDTQTGQLKVRVGNVVAP